MCEQFDLKPLFLGKLRPEWLTSNQMVSQQRTSFACRHKQPIYFLGPNGRGPDSISWNITSFFATLCIYYYDTPGKPPRKGGVLFQIMRKLMRDVYGKEN